jgi:hypothetical protein
MPPLHLLFPTLGPLTRQWRQPLKILLCSVEDDLGFSCILCYISDLKMYQSNTSFVAKAHSRCYKIFSCLLQFVCFLISFEDVYMLFKMLQKHDFRLT